MDKFTFGNFQCAVNLVADILENPEYKKYSRRVARLLGKQFKTLLAVSTISDKRTRETTLKMWHAKFKEFTEGLPEVVKTHTLCVETARFRQLLREAK